MTVTVIALQAGDRVAARGDDPEFQVASVDTQQGRVQVAATTGEAHTYSRDDSVEVTR